MFWQKHHELLESGNSFCLVILTEALGSAPQVSGAKMLCDQNGLIAGTIGGGKVEAKALELARMLLKEKKSTQFVEWHLEKDVGMTCGGKVKLYFETYNPMVWSITIFGAGHVSQALVRLLLNLECSLTVIDSRADWLDKLPMDAKLRKVQNADPKSEIAKLSSASFVLLMTQGHTTDFPILLECMRRAEAFSYLGVIGSKSKRKTLVHDLLASGISAEKAEQFFCPIGLPLGKSTPEEIAISVAAQLLQVRDAGK